MIRVGIMASGFSARLGNDKLLADLQGYPLIQWTLRAALESDIGPVTLIYRTPEVEAIGKRMAVETQHNSDAELGQSAAVRMIVDYEDSCGGYLFLPGDQPLILAETLRQMAQIFKASPQSIVSMSVDGVPYSPTVFPLSCRAVLMALEGDRGGRIVAESGIWQRILVPAQYAWEAWDVDRSEDLERIRRTAHLINLEMK